MPHTFTDPADIVRHNRAAWDRQAAQQCEWSRPVDPDALAARMERGEALVFGHTLAQQIGGQLDAGFVLTGFHEDRHPQPRFLIDRYMATFLATRARKPACGPGLAD